MGNRLGFLRDALNVNREKLRERVTIGQQPRLHFTDRKAEHHVRSRVRQETMAKQGGTIGVRIQITKHQPRPTASGLVVSVQPLIQLVFALLAVDLNDVDAQVAADPPDNRRVDQSLRSNVDCRHA